ncbi:histidine ammonia-lyase [Aureimonas endophytica]|uniref:Histidine ammonia-lyase n=1 Tax=Aureimonas endophytica TaxID=2027858 RepID=A0A917E593_9HYPH|nr:aromatic amino acid lyase [Aureimonas endophytica]GGE04376.1 histidine ammonia-lyase [Aureimonas endophytica]
MPSLSDSPAPVILGRAPVGARAIAAIARGATVVLDEAALARMADLHRRVGEAVSGGRAIYGLTTGVGDLYSVALRPDELSRAQMNMLRSHASGVGEPLDATGARAIMAVLVEAFLKGASGVSPDLVVTMTAMLNRGVTPVAPIAGSVGYLIATSHIGLAIFGEGEAFFAGERLPGGEALACAGIPLHQPGAREGHSLISNACEITGLGALAVARIETLLPLADLAGAMSLEALRGNTRGYDPRLHRLRPHPGQIATADRLLSLLDGSEILAANRDHRLQDALSLRCIPQVHGAARDTFEHVRRVIEIEIDSVTDNPVFTLEDDELVALPGGNGHGAPTALALDHLAIAIAALSTISQARSDRLTSRHLSGLPAFLADGSAAHSGFMIPPYVAAGLAGDNRALAAPASVHTVSTCAGQEDHVSMGVSAALKARKAADNLADILSIELLCAAEALDLHAPLRPGRGTAAARDAIRSRVPRRLEDRVMAPDLAAVRALIDGGDLQAFVAAAIRSE